MFSTNKMGLGKKRKALKVFKEETKTPPISSKTLQIKYKNLAFIKYFDYPKQNLVVTKKLSVRFQNFL